MVAMKCHQGGAMDTRVYTAYQVTLRQLQAGESQKAIHQQAATEGATH